MYFGWLLLIASGSLGYVAWKKKFFSSMWMETVDTLQGQNKYIKNFTTICGDSWRAFLK